VSDPKPTLVPHLAPASELRRLGRNLSGYLGETIDISAVLGDCVDAATRHGWRIERVRVAPEEHLLAMTRGASVAPDPASDGGERRQRIYLSTGIHGDEPAGPLAVRRLLQDDAWPHGADLWLCPCLNPAGITANRRENSDGVDLNREYLKPQAKETIAHIGWLERQPALDLCLCLHEDWESHGFYVYELNPDNRPSVAEFIVKRVAEVCPIDLSESIEGRPAKDGIIRPNLDPRSRPQWPEAFYLITHKTRLSYTLEAPSDFPLPARVNALVAGVQAALSS
jgi:hypothetical protein